MSVTAAVVLPKSNMAANSLGDKSEPEVLKAPLIDLSGANSSPLEFSGGLVTPRPQRWEHVCRKVYVAEPILRLVRGTGGPKAT